MIFPAPLAPKKEKLVESCMFGPTSQQLEVYEIQKRLSDDARRECSGFFSEVIPALNRTLQAAGHGAIMANPE